MKTILLIIASIAIVICLSSCKTTQTMVDRSKQTEEAGDVPDHSTSSLDWIGIYSGTLPCADCDGIQTLVNLQRDSSYVIRTTYVGKSDTAHESRGTFSWNGQGGKITLKDADPAKSPSMYQLGENTLTHLDVNGNKIAGESSARYVLVKVYPGITEKYWKVTELYGKPVPRDETYRKEPHLILKSEANRLAGHGGCNAFTGSYEVKTGNRIAFSKIVSTRMACPNMEIESQLFKVLDSVDNYVLNGDTLTLNKARMAPLARFEAVYLK